MKLIKQSMCQSLQFMTQKKDPSGRVKAKANNLKNKTSSQINILILLVNSNRQLKKYKYDNLLFRYKHSLRS